MNQSRAKKGYVIAEFTYPFKQNRQMIDKIRAIINKLSYTKASNNSSTKQMQ